MKLLTDKEIQALALTAGATEDDDGALVTRLIRAAEAKVLAELTKWEVPEPTYVYHTSDVEGEDELYEYQDSGPVDKECLSCIRLFTLDQLNTAHAAGFAAGSAAESALLKVLSAVQRYLPPDGISEKDALTEIIACVDPRPLYTRKEPT